MITRRGFIGFLAAPSIVRVASLMPISVIDAAPSIYARALPLGGEWISLYSPTLIDELTAYAIVSGKTVRL